LLYLPHPCSRRQLLLRCSTSRIHAVVGNCSCVALPPASMQSSATAPALLYLPHPCSRRQLLLRCSTSRIHAVVGNCSCVALPPASMQSSATAPALLYLPHPCSRPLFLENLPRQRIAAYIFQSFPKSLNKKTLRLAAFFLCNGIKHYLLNLYQSRLSRPFAR
jgi:hypothetical protein